MGGRKEAALPLRSPTDRTPRRKKCKAVAPLPTLHPLATTTVGAPIPHLQGGGGEPHEVNKPAGIASDNGRVIGAGYSVQ